MVFPHPSEKYAEVKLDQFDTTTTTYTSLLLSVLFLGEQKKRTQIFQTPSTLCTAASCWKLRNFNDRKEALIVCLSHFLRTFCLWLRWLPPSEIQWLVNQRPLIYPPNRNKGFHEALFLGVEVYVRLGCRLTGRKKSDQSSEIPGALKLTASSEIRICWRKRWLDKKCQTYSPNGGEQWWWIPSNRIRKKITVPKQTKVNWWFGSLWFGGLASQSGIHFGDPNGIPNGITN